MERRNAKSIHYIEKISHYFEMVIAFLILAVIVIRVVEITVGLFGAELVILKTDFDNVISLAFSLVIGVEFTKMLCKHTPETVIDVLLFTVARQAIVYHESTSDILIGVAAIAGLFAVKKHLIRKRNERKTDEASEGFEGF